MVTQARVKKVDFSVSFMRTGIGILYVRPQLRVPSVFSFLNPLSITVWMSILAANCLVSITLYVVAKISINETACSKKDAASALEPHEPSSVQVWSEKKPTQETTEEISLAKSFWFTLAAMLQQGQDINSK